ncbi:hypothetical protein EDB89DRAFT_1326482 [Lactarius sanguifluus]|nr:hypothetical protein EDB89DRAFT_1326482 [Lactarius sanguifluus]
MLQRAFTVTPRQASRAYAARASLPTVRQLHASPTAFKTATEKAAEVADKVNKSVGRGLASAIETGEQVTEKTKQTLGKHACVRAGPAPDALIRSRCEPLQGLRRTERRAAQRIRQRRRRRPRMRLRRRHLGCVLFVRGCRGRRELPGSLFL